MRRSSPRISTRRSSARRSSATRTSDELAVLGLGSNLPGPLGAPRECLAVAAGVLGALLLDPALGPLLRTEPLSALPQAPFLNTVLLGRPRLDPEALLACAKALERAAGRRAGPRGGARPLDVDLLLYGARASARPELALPHPRLAARRFALLPLARLAPNLPVPPDGSPAARLLAELGDAGGAVEEIAGPGWSG